MVDASAMLEVLLRTPAAPRVGARILATNETLHVPHLIDLEIAHVLRRWVRSGELPNDRAEEALDDFVEMPLARYSHTVLLARIWELRHNVTAYDAAYLALAEMLDAPLITRDRALAGAGSHARVEVL